MVRNHQARADLGRTAGGNAATSSRRAPGSGASTPSSHTKLPIHEARQNDLLASQCRARAFDVNPNLSIEKRSHGDIGCSSDRYQRHESV